MSSKSRSIRRAKLKKDGVLRPGARKRENPLGPMVYSYATGIRVREKPVASTMR